MLEEHKEMLIDEITKMLKETTDTELIHLIYLILYKSDKN